MTILVTGGCGFIGTNFVINWFRNSDEKLINVDCMTYASNATCVDEPPHKNLINLEVDITNNEMIKEIFSAYRPRAVIHFAAESHVDRSINSADQFIKTNINGTYNLLVYALNYFESSSEEIRDIFKFIHVSTDEVFGSLEPKDDGFTETSPYKPNSPYSASKAASDHLARCYFETFGFPTIVTNCSNNYGPHQHSEKFIPTVLNSFITGKKIPVYGDGRQVRDWLYVEDHCDALLSVLDRGLPGESYNIGGNCELTNLELIQLIFENIQKLKPDVLTDSLDNYISFVEDRLGHDRRYAIDARKMQIQLGWLPSHDFSEGIEATIEWYSKDLVCA